MTDTEREAAEARTSLGTPRAAVAAARCIARAWQP